jgi:hypothetical protein
MIGGGSMGARRACEPRPYHMDDGGLMGTRRYMGGRRAYKSRPYMMVYGIV